jgi:hypothetical protein
MAPLIVQNGGFRSATGGSVRKCLTWIPEYECRWTSSSEAECWVKKWHCTSWWVGWNRQPV